MTAIILKIILCSSIFIAVYYLFLEKEKMLRFNRLYLLSSLVISYIIPFVTITLPNHSTEKMPQMIIEETAQQLVFIPQKQESFNWMNVVWEIYIFITLFLLIKSFISLVKLKKISGKRHIYQNHTILLTKENLSPFSFWNTMYMGENYMKNDTIDQRIFIHERTHIEQNHSLDLLILNTLKVFTWFNPVLFLYKKAMITNHEFLADEAVVKSNCNIKDYQNLILEEILNHQNPPLTHSFNFNNTKKRFIMMKTKKSKFSLLKKTAGITVLITAAVLFSERTYAGNSTHVFLSERIAEIPDQIVHKESKQTDLKSQDYFEKTKEEGKSSGIIDSQKEELKKVQDTIIPKADKTRESKNTNSSVNTQQNTNEFPAQYPGGPKDLKIKISRSVDVSKLGDYSSPITSTAYIHINEAGKTTLVTTSGENEILNRELLKTVTEISNETVWIPAMKDGKNIASVLKVPATMTFTRQ
ncbi:M56 family metallopeptidase [uncultured Chryseobacterium sp.]|uniref:M56 family metallopeptidase n=1 Tax=uncultured Chryseobacterium sp. TaxID=259322 RepID=UPI00258CEA5B|nr:M56 family metallopeptidase [uncultured Chryseobacterium sp.]